MALEVYEQIKLERSTVAYIERARTVLDEYAATGHKMTLRQLFLRPWVTVDPHRTPVRGLYICSASTPPGAGVHGMCGHLAALAALRDNA